MSKNRVQQQFGANAAAYATSTIHAKGASLARLVALTQPQPHWRVLDIATAAGHTAFAFAPFVAEVVATDITLPMLHVAQSLGQEREIGNARFVAVDAEDIPFAADSFHLVTCRIAPHHFPYVDRFVQAAARVLRPGGLLAVADNVVPGSRLRGKKAKLQRQAGTYVNAFEKLRDPSHGRCLSQNQWQDVFQAAGLPLIHQETIQKRLDFDAWAARSQVSPADRVRLRAMLLQAPQPVVDFLTPQMAGDRISFQLHEIILVGKKPAES